MANNRKRNGSKKPFDRRRSDDRYEDRRNAQRGKGECKNDSEAMNDISWYSRYPNLLAAAGSFPYPNRPGMTLQLGQFTDPSDATKTYNRNFTIPGVMVLDWLPTIGNSATATDPASVAAKEFYARVRTAYSSDLAVDAPDFLVYIMALDSLFSYIAWLKRLYRVLTAWTPDNYVLPDVLLTAMGLKYKDIVNLRANKTQLWQCINELVLQSRKFTCPAVMDIFNRHYWMSDNVYTDEMSINSQFYMFNLRAVLKYADLQIDTEGHTASGLQCTPLPNCSQTGRLQQDAFGPIDFYNFGLSLIEALVAWDDAYTIIGYLGRAFQGTPNFVVDELPIDQPFTPQYVPEVLMQIENSRTIYGAGAINFPYQGFNITQNPLTNAVICAPEVVGLFNNADGNGLLGGGWSIPPILSVRSDAPTVGDSVIASRLQAAVKSYVSVSGTVTYTIYCGTEVPLTWRLVTETNDLTDRLGGTIYPQTPTLDNGADSVINYLLWLTVEQFDWHPFSW